jgi:DNA-binding NarL/FixJ family response regulator
MKTNKKIEIFIVEDNKIFAIALKADLETAFANMPINIQIFGTGEACMESFREERPQVVIMDYHLNSKNPEAADGIKVLDWIKKINPKTNVIILTGDDHIDIALKSFKHGASDYVVKTDTQFRKIIYTLFNLFRIMEAKTETKRYKFLVVGLCIFISMMMGVILAIQIFDPSLLVPK